MSEKQSMPITIPATKAHRQFGELVRRAYSGEEHFIVEKDGLPVVALISIIEYQELMKERKQKEERLRSFREATRSIGEEAQRKGLTEEDIEAQVETVRQQLYQERYGK